MGVGRSERRGDAAGILAILTLTALLAVFGISRATGHAFAIQMWTLLGGALAGYAMLVHFLGAGPSARVDPATTTAS